MTANDVAPGSGSMLEAAASAAATASPVGPDTTDAVVPGTPDPTDAGVPDSVEPGIQAPTPALTDDGVTERAGSTPQFASGRADVPAPAQPTAGGAVVGSSDAAAAPSARPAPEPLPQQLGGRAFALAQSAADTPGGTSTITVTVAPDDLGPITVRASFAPDGTRLEFFSSTDGGREALKQALPDLRREASSSGLSASLDLGTGTPDDRSDGRRDESSGLARATVHRPVQDTPWTRSPATGSSTLDLFA